MINITANKIIASNRYWTWMVGLSGDRWLGLAFGATRDENGRGYMHVFSEVCEGIDLGLRDQAAAIRLTSALAADPASTFGAVNRWFIPEAERGSPDEFRCDNCGEIGCQGECLQAVAWDSSEWE